MASLLLPVTMQICTLNSGVSKLVATACRSDRIECTCSLKRMLGPKICSSRKIRPNINNAALNRREFRGSIASQTSVESSGTALQMSNENGKLERGFSYLFRTEVGGSVKVSVGPRSGKYLVHIEVSGFPLRSSEHNLVVSWGIFRSDSAQLIVPDSQIPAQAEIDPVWTPFTTNSLGWHTIDLEFDCARAPFYLSFLLHLSSDAAASDSGIRTHRKTKFCVPVGIGPGYPTPLGVNFLKDGSVNFSLFSKNAESIVLCLYDEMARKPSLEIYLDPYTNKTGDIWHVLIPSANKYTRYGYRCKGSIFRDKRSGMQMHHVLLDPYAKVLQSLSPDSESVSLVKPIGRLQKETSFDWYGDVHPNLPMERLVVYRLNVGHFTQDKSSQLPGNIVGTFAGVIEKLHHFKSLGVNAILLEPIFSFDEQKGPYFPYHFFSPMHIYGPTRDSSSAINSMKEMVKALHANGIEVLLEVVFTHTAEGGDVPSQMITLRGIDKSSYYTADTDTESGAHSVLNCNSPVVLQMILDSLRHWVVEFHVDGFCFINASSLVNGSNSSHLPRPPLVEAIAFDPVLSKTKIIADCWSPLEMLCDEIRFPHWKRWAEMNTRFCYDVRSFLRGEGLLSNLATRLCGSGDLFSDSRGPAYSFNFVSKNFGLPLVDLVSFSGDKLSSELSWNCGEEGPTDNSDVLAIRLKQIRNFLFVLFISLGVPVLNMGDECGHSTGGSPSYSDRMPFNWNLIKTGFAVQVMQFIGFLSSLRIRRNDLLQMPNFLKLENIDWHGNDQTQPNWEDPSCKFLAVTLKAETSDKGDLFITFNSSDLLQSVVMPQLSEGYVWFRLVDTARPYPGFFSSDNELNVHQIVELTDYEIKPYSCVLFEAKRSETKTQG